MQKRILGESTLEVSRICLGTMTWGVQNTAEEAAAQLDLAVERGVNFIDTAEMYPVPPSPETYGRTEEYIGQRLKSSGKRDDLVIATKMVGPARFVREGRGLNPDEIETAVDGSLKRLGIDKIDLYQLHWPQRQMNMMAQRDFQPHKHVSLAGEQMEAMLEGLARMIEAGKIRYIGLSNETPWGIMRYLELHRTKGLPRVVSVQNPYSLMQRNWDVHLGEVAMRENVPLLAYSPLAGGILSGKYLNGHKPEGARFSLPWGSSLMGRHAANADSEPVAAYAALAKEAGITPTQLALGFVNSRPYLGANIIGATSTEQLEECLSAEDIQLSEDILDKIEELHDHHPSPSLGRTGPRDAA